jgi:Fic family protein
MADAKFIHYDLKLVEPKFGSSLTDLIIELDYLRRKKLVGTTPSRTFFQLKHIFHTLESLGSARIEGNNTTIAEYIETKISNEHRSNPGIAEIQNIERAMEFIETTIKDHSIDRSYISELHRIVVRDLPPPPSGEGDRNPGSYRRNNLKIAKSDHLPPDWMQVEAYMDELISFINRNDAPKYDLLKAAIAHHRFVWVHPFGNGNGRTVRLFTYAMLVKTGFHLDIGRIINPTAVFCNNRIEYYNFLSGADKGTPEGILTWSQYVLKGLKEEIEKNDKLAEYEYLKKIILLPAVSYSLDRKLITDVEAKILRRTIEKKVVQAGDLKDIFEGKASAEISRQIRKLIERKMLIQESPRARKYQLSFSNSYLIRGIINALGENGFLPLKE